MANMKAARPQPAKDKAPAAKTKATKRAIRAELYKPENIEKARRLDRGPMV
jgi:hypothetical protein